jgi:hypothetical protein
VYQLSTLIFSVDFNKISLWAHQMKIIEDHIVFIKIFCCSKLKNCSLVWNWFDLIPRWLCYNFFFVCISTLIIGLYHPNFKGFKNINNLTLVSRVKNVPYNNGRQPKWLCCNSCFSCVTKFWSASSLKSYNEMVNQLWKSLQNRRAHKII